MTSRLLTVLTVVLAAAPAVAAPARVAKVATEEQLILPAEGPYKVVVNNLKGRVVVRGWDKNVAYVRASKASTQALSADETDMLEAAKTEISRPGATTVEVGTRWVGHEKTYPAVLLTEAAHMDVDYTIMVPPSCAVEVHQESGPVIVYGVDGRVVVTTRDGDISVSDAKGRVEATSERGDLRFSDVDGDAVAKNQHGAIRFEGVTGDIRAASRTGDVRVDVPPRFAGEVSFHTVSGVFRSDLATFHTDLEPGDRGYVGILRGPLAGHAEPDVRFRIDTVSGTATVANARTPYRR